MWRFYIGAGSTEQGLDSDIADEWRRSELKEVTRVPYKVVKGDNNTPRVDIDGRLYTPQEISAMILQKMKKTAEDYLGQEVTEAVIKMCIRDSLQHQVPRSRQ